MKRLSRVRLHPKILAVVTVGLLGILTFALSRELTTTDRPVVTRLAARSGGKLHPCAAAAGPKEKRTIGQALSAATGKPLMGDFGRRIL